MNNKIISDCQHTTDGIKKSELYQNKIKYNLKINIKK